MKIYVPGSGAIGAKLAIVGEAPSYEEEESRIPLTGPSGRLTNAICNDAGFSRDQCWVTNVSKYMIIPQQKGKYVQFSKRAEQAGVDLEEQIKALRAELKEIKPNCILALGGSALWALTGHSKIEKWRGSVLQSFDGIKVVGTYHPAHILRSGEGEGKKTGYWQKYVMQFDFKRAWEQSQFPEIRRPSRHLTICRNSNHLYEFINSFIGNKNKVSVDIEAIHCIPVCIGLAFDKYSGMSVPLWGHTDVCKISDIPDVDLAQIWILLSQLFHTQSMRIIGQNFKYDDDKLRRLGFTFHSIFSDTMLKSFTISPELPTNLAFNTSTHTDEPYYKEEGLEFDYRKHKIDDLLLYNARDSCVTTEIDEVQEGELDELGLKKFFYNFIMELHNFYLHIENNGFLVDEPKRMSLLEKYVKWDEKIRYELFQLTEHFFHTDNYHWKETSFVLHELLKIPFRQGTGEEVLTQLLGNVVKDEKRRKVIELILEGRRVNRTVGSSLMSQPDSDGRMRSTYYPCLDTGRSASFLMEPPIRPKITVSYRDADGKKKTKKKDFGFSYQTQTKHGDIGADVRECYVADEGHVFINADKSQAEARVVALLANDEEMLQMYDHHDIHALTASWFMGGTEESWSKKVLGYECPERFLGKTIRHAGHLGAKKRRAATEINTQARKYGINISMSEYKAGKALEIFHARCPNIKKVFQAEVIKCMEQDRMLRAPKFYGFDIESGAVRTFHERWGDELFRKAFSFLPQNTVSNDTKGGGIRIRRRIPDIKIMGESHDALLFMIPEEKLNEWTPIIKEEMERPIDFSCCSLKRHELIIPCELEISKDLLNFKKFKLGGL